jgi:hypothetical protein
VKTNVIIESRDLDTDERERVEIEVEPATELHQQRSTLIALVAERHQGAKLRSFADGAATFLDSQHLVVASYSPRTLARKPASADPDAQQDELFAA